MLQHSKAEGSGEADGAESSNVAVTDQLAEMNLERLCRLRGPCEKFGPATSSRSSLQAGTPPGALALM